MKENNKIGIILVNYNGAKYNKECIDSIKNSTYKNYEIIVVDNASQDNSVELLKKDYEDLTIIESKENLGFSGGNNLGIDYGLKNNCEFILLLNNDTKIENNMLENMINVSIENNKAVISPKIYYYDNKEIIWSAGAKMFWKRGIPAQNGINEIDTGRYDLLDEVDIATGCCLLIHKDIVKKVGLLSLEYFLYYEDTDYIMRIKEKGFKVLYDPTSIMYHKVSASTGGEESENYIYYNTRNRLIFNNKFNRKNKIYYVPYFVLTRVVKIFMWLVQGKFNLISATICGIKDYIQGNIGIRLIEEN
ncbi:MAG: glycosyltransferase family 2 protein [Clostridium perfringens]|nr:glycosyltransferase family 2 protein [Clostridium perfringens]